MWVDQKIFFFFAGRIFSVSLCRIFLHDREGQTKTLLLLSDSLHLSCEDVPQQSIWSVPFPVVISTVLLPVEVTIWELETGQTRWGLRLRNPACQHADSSAVFGNLISTAPLVASVTSPEKAHVKVSFSDSFTVNDSATARLAGTLQWRDFSHDWAVTRTQEVDFLFFFRGKKCPEFLKKLEVTRGDKTPPLKCHTITLIKDLLASTMLLPSRAS